VRDTLKNHSGMACGGWYVIVWVKRKVGLAHNLDSMLLFGGPNDLDNLWLFYVHSNKPEWNGIWLVRC
jgi:hypothetical protein